MTPYVQEDQVDDAAKVRLEARAGRIACPSHVSPRGVLRLDDEIRIQPVVQLLATCVLLAAARYSTPSVLQRRTYLDAFKGHECWREGMRSVCLLAARAPVDPEGAADIGRHFGGESDRLHRLIERQRAAACPPPEHVHHGRPWADERHHWGSIKSGAADGQVHGEPAGVPEPTDRAAHDHRVRRQQHRGEFVAGTHHGRRTDLDGGTGRPRQRWSISLTRGDDADRVGFRS